MRTLPATEIPSVVRRRRTVGGQVDEVVVRGREGALAPATTENPLEPYVAELGTVGDGVIADKAGVPRWRVVEYRKKLGIPAYDGFRFQRRADAEAPPPAPIADANERAKKLTAIGSRRAGRPSPLDAHVHLLGTMPDSAVAQRVGVTVAAVTQYRRRRGIAPSGRAATAADVRPAHPVAKVPTEPVAKVTVEVVPTEGQFAYKVSVQCGDEERKFFTLAPNIRAGLAQAEAALADRTDGPWLVTGIRLAGDAFPTG